MECLCKQKTMPATKIWFFFFNSDKINVSTSFPHFGPSCSYLSVNAASVFVRALSTALFWDLWAALMPWNSGRDNDKALLSSSTQPLQVPLESDIFLKPKVVADFAPPTLGINSRQIMWDMSYGRANLSSAMRHKSSIPPTGTLPHKWGLFCLHCRAGAARAFSARVAEEGKATLWRSSDCEKLSENF